MKMFLLSSINSSKCTFEAVFKLFKSPAPVTTTVIITMRTQAQPTPPPPQIVAPLVISIGKDRYCQKVPVFECLECSKKSFKNSR